MTKHEKYMFWTMLKLRLQLIKEQAKENYEKISGRIIRLLSFNKR